LQAVNADALDRVVSSWLTRAGRRRHRRRTVTASVAVAPAPAATPAAGETMRAIAVEGKSARASMGRRPIRFAAFDQASAVVLGTDRGRREDQ
jgi:hypothetical protein